MTHNTAVIQNDEETLDTAAMPDAAASSVSGVTPNDIIITNVNKTFGKKQAVIDLNLTVPKGSVFGLLGHNGAGKSTTLGMLLGQVIPDTGSLSIRGHDVQLERRQALAKVGAIFESPAFYGYLSGMRNLKALQALTGPIDQKRIDYIVEWVGMAPRIHDKVAAYSHGMRQRLALAQALIHEPELLILDEPTDGLDPEGIHEMRELVLRLNREFGLTILFSSHMLSEVEQVCTHVAVMRKAKLLYAGRWDREAATRNLIMLRCDQRDEVVKRLKQDAVLETDYQPTGEGAADRFKLQAEMTIADLAERLVGQGIRIHALAPVELTLEEFYMQLRENDGDSKSEGDQSS